MAEGSAVERDVVLALRLASDPRNKAAAAEVQALVENIRKAAETPIALKVAPASATRPGGGSVVEQPGTRPGGGGSGPGIEAVERSTSKAGKAAGDARRAFAEFFTAAERDAKEFAKTLDENPRAALEKATAAVESLMGEYVQAARTGFETMSKQDADLLQVRLRHAKEMVKAAEQAWKERVEEAKTSLDRIRESEVRAAKDRVNAVREIQRRQKEAADAAEAADQRAIMARRQYAASLAQTLTGDTELARGIAMMGIASEEDTEKLLRKIVVLEGLFSTIKGGVSVYRGITAAVQAYAAAQKAAAAAEAAAATARGLGGAASGVAGGAAGRVAGGAIAGAAGGAVGGAAAGAAGSGAGGGLMAAAVGVVTAPVVLTAIVAAAATAVAYHLLTKGAKGSAAESEQRTKSMEERRRQALEMQQAARQRAAHQGQEWLAVSTEMEELRRRGEDDDIPAGGTADEQNAARLRMLRGRRARAAHRFEQAEAGAAAAEHRAQERRDNQQFANPEELAAAQNRLRAAAGDVEQTERAITEALKQQKDLREQNVSVAEREVETSKQSVEQARKAVEMEQQKLQGAQAQFGRMDPAEQRELMRIRGKVEKGGADALSRQELEFLDQTGLAKEFTDKQFGKFGGQAGFGKFADTFGVDDDLESAQKERSDRELLANIKNLTDAKDRERDASRQLEEQALKLKGALSELTTVIEGINKVRLDAADVAPRDAQAALANQAAQNWQAQQAINQQTQLALSLAVLPVAFTP